MDQFTMDRFKIVQEMEKLDKLLKGTEKLEDNLLNLEKEYLLEKSDKYKKLYSRKTALEKDEDIVLFLYGYEKELSDQGYQKVLLYMKLLETMKKMEKHFYLLLGMKTYMDMEVICEALMNVEED